MFVTNCYDEAVDLANVDACKNVRKRTMLLIKSGYEYERASVNCDIDSLKLDCIMKSISLFENALKFENQYFYFSFLFTISYEVILKKIKDLREKKAFLFVGEFFLFIKYYLYKMKK